MRVLHAAYTSNPSPGVVRQMEYEQQSADSLGLEWSARMFGTIEHESSISVIPTVNPKDRAKYKNEFYQWLIGSQHNYDVLLLRYTKYDPMQIQFLSKWKKPCFFVHHTLEGPQILLEGRRFAFARVAIDNWVFSRCLKSIRGFVAMTEEIASYELRRAHNTNLPWFVYPNGISIRNQTSANNKINLRSTHPNIMFVAAQFIEWHGLDLLQQSVATSNENFTIHLVGRLTDEQKITLEKDKRYQLHGRLDFQTLNSLTKRCDIGLGAFAFYRKNMSEACTLKVREYLAAGLPVYCGHKDVFPSSMPYFFHGEPNIQNILEFCARHRNTNRQEIIEASMPWIDKKALVERLYNEIKVNLDFQEE